MVNPSASVVAAACLIAALGGCSRDSSRTADAPPPAAAQGVGLRGSLAEIGGAYQWNAELKTHVFSDKPAIATVIGEGSDQTIAELVECLDDTAPARTVLEGRPVPVGVLCHEALGQIVYYEPTDPNGDVARSWPGHIEPSATPAELQGAKRAWQDVVGRKAYRRL
jgi:hypothetical protein